MKNYINKKCLHAFLSLLFAFPQLYALNLAFYNRPKNMNPYQWSTLQIQKKAKQNLDTILSKLKLDSEFWHNTKKQYEVDYKKDIAEEVKDMVKKPITNKIRQATTYIVNHPSIKAILNIQGIKEKKDCIKIYIRNKRLIKIINVEKIATSTFDRTIMLNAAESELTSIDILIANLAHELAHIHHEHGLIREFVDELYKQFGKKARYLKEEFTKDFEILLCDQENEADIRSIYDDIIVGKKVMLSFKDSDVIEMHPEIEKGLAEEMEDEDDPDYDSHPSCQERYNLLKSINDIMEYEITQPNLNMLFMLTKSAIESEEYFKAQAYIDQMQNIPTNKKNLMNLFKTYINAHIKLKNKMYFEARALFAQLTNQAINQVIKTKSIFMLGLFDLNSINNRANGIKIMQASLQQHNCIRTKIKAYRILKTIPKEDKSQNNSNFSTTHPYQRFFTNSLSLCEIMNLNTLIRL